MSTVQVPALEDAPAPPPTDRMLRSVLDHDQFDDWLADPVYYEDVRRQIADVAAELEPWVRPAGAFADVAGTLTLSVPRQTGKTMWASYLPLRLRMMARTSSAMVNARLDAKPGATGTPRDKVYGFRYRPDSPELFQLPGADLEKAWSDAEVALSITDEIVVLDVVEFANRATADGLARSLEAAGARSTEASFYRNLLAGAAGLPSIDDAMAAVYDHYLGPVDFELAGAGVNFVRYRDEYLLFRAGDAAAVHAALGEVGLTARQVFSRHIQDLTIDLEREAEFSGDGTAYAEAPVLGGTMRAGWVCGLDRWPCSDAFELVYRPADPGTAAAPWVSGVPTEVADGVAILPSLRSAHKTRAAGVLSSAPFSSAPSTFLAYSKTAARARRWLVRHLDLCATAGATQPMVWTSQLLSDGGPLGSQEVTLLKRVATNSSLPDFARIAAALALARSSTLEEGEFWLTATAGVDWELRTMMLGAAYLAQRGRPAPARALEESARTQPRLLALLRQEGGWPT